MSLGGRGGAMSLGRRRAVAVDELGGADSHVARGKRCVSAPHRPPVPFLAGFGVWCMVVHNNP
jgi:hypothetical protein